ncbi:MAG: hypothetical protein ACRD0P_27440 [Stackebrandtia sp.]
MGLIADKLATMIITVTSPDGHLKGRLRNDDIVNFRIDSHYYSRYADTELAHQIGQVAAGLWHGRQSGHRTVFREVIGTDVTDTPHWNARHRAFRDAHDTMRVRAESPRGCIGLESCGMRDWAAVVQPDTVARLDTDEFVAELRDVMHALIRQYRHQRIWLQHDHFDIGLERLRRTMNP